MEIPNFQLISEEETKSILIISQFHMKRLFSEIPQKLHSARSSEIGSKFYDRFSPRRLPKNFLMLFLLMYFLDQIDELHLRFSTQYR